MQKLQPEDIPFHIDVNESIHNIEFGDIQFSASVHNGKIRSYTAVGFDERKFRDNVAATTFIMEFLKGVLENRLAGQYSFTVLCNGEGIIRSVTLQKHHKKVYSP